MGSLWVELGRKVGGTVAGHGRKVDGTVVGHGQNMGGTSVGRGWNAGRPWTKHGVGLVERKGCIRAGKLGAVFDGCGCRGFSHCHVQVTLAKF